MTVARHFSAPMSVDEALAECRRESGSQSAPEAVAALEVLLAADPAGLADASPLAGTGGGPTR
jgi:HD-GYP domain-containing protein (c-di-GMP phosphodiesterase class II)